jgi:hypothetical protein
MVLSIGRSVYLNETFFGRVADTALIGAVAYNGVTAYLADPDRIGDKVLSGVDRLESLQVKTVMDLFNRHRILETNYRSLVAFAFGLGQELRIHALEFVCLTGDGRFKVSRCLLDTRQNAKVHVRVNGLGFGRSAKQFGHLGETILIGLLGESQILAVSLTFASERSLQIIVSRHLETPLR